MAGSGARSCWVSSVVGEEPAFTTHERSSREVQTRTHVHDQVTVSMPTFEGRYKP